MNSTGFMGFFNATISPLGPSNFGAIDVAPINLARKGMEASDEKDFCVFDGGFVFKRYDGISFCRDGSHTSDYSGCQDYEAQESGKD
jgi:hypothetical protein